MPPPESPYVERHSKMAYAFFFPSDQPLGISPQLRHIGHFTIKHFERTSSSFRPLPSVLASGCGSIILLLEESQPAALNRY